MKVDDAVKLLDKRNETSLHRMVLAYLENHPDEVFRPTDKEDLAAKISWPNPGSIPSVLVELARRGLISSVNVKQYVVYGKHEAIDDLRKKLPNWLMPIRRELAAK